MNDQQQQAIESLEGETLVIAGAGSGKTSVLTKRVANLIQHGVEPSSILCVTFTNKAAAEMRSRVYTELRNLNIEVPQVPSWSEEYLLYNPLVCTFHSLGVKILREFGDRISLKKNFTILDSDDQEKIIKNIISKQNLDPKQYPVRPLISFISSCKQELLSPSKSRRLEKEYPEVVHRIYSEYQQALSNNDSVDFDDLIFRTHELISNNVEIRTILHNRWKHIMVDEFQDTNQAQYSLIQLMYNPIIN
jgi:DNA helicase II / ATP-dependent DNA helicase PcrA